MLKVQEEINRLTEVLNTLEKKRTTILLGSANKFTVFNKGEGISLNIDETTAKVLTSVLNDITTVNHRLDYFESSLKLLVDLDTQLLEVYCGV